MCGITGWLCAPGNQPVPDVLERMAESIRHRGPDNSSGNIGAWLAGYFVAVRDYS
jgi:asparagine synthetase B (glutamine-hydrolysing)